LPYFLEQLTILVVIDGMSRLRGKEQQSYTKRSNHTPDRGPFRSFMPRGCGSPPRWQTSNVKVPHILGGFVHLYDQ
jgi:hypothetical protein